MVLKAQVLGVVAVTQFQKYPKTPRLNRNCVITEKIDGTNSGIHVGLEPVGGGRTLETGTAPSSSVPTAIWCRPSPGTR